jgi:hypothetical protein
MFLSLAQMIRGLRSVCFLWICLYPPFGSWVIPQNQGLECLKMLKEEGNFFSFSLPCILQEPQIALALYWIVVFLRVKHLNSLKVDSKSKFFYPCVRDYPYASICLVFLGVSVLEHILYGLKIFCFSFFLL